MAAILFPVFAKAREKARQASCSSNLKQLGIALLAYAQDYDENFPPILRSPGPGEHSYDTPSMGQRVYYTQMLEPYIKNHELYVCPSGVSRECCFPIRRSYHMNYNLFRYVSRPMAEITNPANTIAMADAGYGMLFGNDPYTGFYDGPPPPGAVAGARTWSYETEPWVAWRHNEGANSLWIDGHVKWIKRNTILAIQLEANQG